MLKLIYFKMRALAEAPQLLLNYSGIEYEYLMSWEYFDDVWQNVKPKIPFQQLPMMEACLLYTSPSPRDRSISRMPSSA